MSIVSILPSSDKIVLVTISGTQFTYQVVKLSDVRSDGAQLKEVHSSLDIIFREQRPEKVVFMETVLSGQRLPSKLRIKIEGVIQFICETNQISCSSFTTIKTQNYLKRNPDIFTEHYGCSEISPRYISDALILPFLS
jgi:hypothetical protein